MYCSLVVVVFVFRDVVISSQITTYIHFRRFPRWVLVTFLFVASRERCFPSLGSVPAVR